MPDIPFVPWNLEVLEWDTVQALPFAGVHGASDVVEVDGGRLLIAVLHDSFHGDSVVLDCLNVQRLGFQ